MSDQDDSSAKTLLQDHFRSNEMVEIVVRRGDDRFYVHKSLLMGRSEFCDRQLSSIESDGRSVDLHPQLFSSRSFEPFMMWLYGNHGSIFGPNSKRKYYLGLVWSTAKNLASADYLNFLVDEIQAVDADISWYLNACIEMAICPEQTTLSNYLNEYLAYQVITGGWRQFEDTACKAKWDEFVRRFDGVLLTNLFRTIDKLNEDQKCGTLSDPKQAKGCKWHSHRDSESEKLCERSQVKNPGNVATPTPTPKVKRKTGDYKRQRVATTESEQSD